MLSSEFTVTTDRMTVSVFRHKSFLISCTLNHKNMDRHTSTLDTSVEGREVGRVAARQTDNKRMHRANKQQDSKKQLRVKMMAYNTS
jgi:hypothetical protein